MRKLFTLFALPLFAAAALAATPAEIAIEKAQAEIAKRPDHAPYYNGLAMAYARRARETSDVRYYEKAGEALKKSFALSADNFEGLKIVAWLELGRHEFAKALETATALNKKVPDDVTVYGYLVDANAELGNYQEAVDAAQWMLNLRPGNVPALTRAGYLRELHGNLDGAIEMMQAAYDSTPYSETEDRAWLLTQIAHLHLVSGDLAKAETYAGGALDVFPNYHYALGLLAQVRIAQARFTDAVPLLERRYEAAPHAENLYALAEALELAGRKEEAAQAFAEFERKSLAESSIADNSNHELIAYYIDHARKPAQALQIAEREVARRHDAFTLDSHAWALAANGDTTGALAQSRRALQFGVKDPKILFHAGAIALRAGRHDEADKYLRDAASRYCREAEALLRSVSGRIVDPQGLAVPGATLSLSSANGTIAQTVSGSEGGFRFEGLDSERYTLRAESAGFVALEESVTLPRSTAVNLQFRSLAVERQQVVITAQTLEPAVDLRNSEVFSRTLFSRDDQLLEQMNSGIDAGQHEGGGKSLEIRRFGFNLDHGGVNGGLKILVDDVPQNQGTQGHGQGYLGSLKALSPELIESVSLINGPFSPEYGDFSGLGVVHIRQRESLPDELTVRMQGGSFDGRRGFVAWSPKTARADSYFAYEGSYTDGPFRSPEGYRRDNVNANYTLRIDDTQRAGVRFLFGRNRFDSSGQVPLDLVDSGRLDRYGYLDPTDGGRVGLGTLSGYYSKSLTGGDSLKVNVFAGRSLFDLFSNFTFYLVDPVHGDGFQQHDSRLQEGANVQWIHVHRIFGAAATFTAGQNFHDNQIEVALYPRQGRTPYATATSAHAGVANEAAYAQESLILLRGRLLLSGGIRYDQFRFGVQDHLNPAAGTAQTAGRWQGKGSVAFTPAASVPVALHLNYGRGINSSDARAVIQRPDRPRLAATDFYQAGLSSNAGRFSLSADLFLIDHSNEQVYIPDDGSLEFKGPSRAYGYETKLSASLTRHLSLSAGVTKTGNAFYKGGDHRVYVDSAPHFVANAGLTLSSWHAWSGSFRMRAVNHYRLDGEDASIVASGHTVLDIGVARKVNRMMELNFSVDNATNRDYWETQNYFESRVSPGAPIVARIHATPAYPLTASAGMTVRFGSR